MAIKTDVGAYKKIAHKDFEKIQLRIGTIAKVAIHPKNPKLYILLIDMTAADEDIQVVANLEGYKMSELLGKQATVICNIKPELVQGEESQGMLLVSYSNKKPVLIGPHKHCPEGAKAGGIMNSTCHFFEEK